MLTIYSSRHSPGSFTIIFRKGVVVTPLSTDLLRMAVRQSSWFKIAKAHALNERKQYYNNTTQHSGNNENGKYTKCSSYLHLGLQNRMMDKTHLCPSSTAISSAFLPLASLREISALFDKRRFIISAWPAWEAKWRGVTWGKNAFNRMWWIALNTIEYFSPHPCFINRINRCLIFQQNSCTLCPALWCSAIQWCPCVQISTGKNIILLWLRILC